MLEYKKDSPDCISISFSQLEAPILSQGHFRGLHTWELAKLFLRDDEGRTRNRRRHWEEDQKTKNIVGPQ